MLKWTNLDAPLLLIDIDTLSNEFINFDYISCNDKIRLCKITKNYCIFPNVYQYRSYGEEQLIQNIMNDFEVSSAQIICITKNNYLIRNMQMLRIGTIYEGSFNIDMKMYIPDVFCSSTASLRQVLNHEIGGYAAEYLCSYGAELDWFYENPEAPRKICKLFGDKIEISDYSYQLIMGGRYYPSKKYYFSQDPLSATLLQFKESYVRTVDTFFDKTIMLIHNKFNKIDYVATIPMKPKDRRVGRFDRLNSLYLSHSLNLGIQKVDLLKCNKDYSQKDGGELERKMNVKDAFEINSSIDMNNKVIAVIDDIVTTGATATAIAEMLYANGAKMVYFIAMARSQPIVTNYNHLYQSVKCLECNGPLDLSVQDSGEAIYKCKLCNSEFNVESILEQIKIVNCLPQKSFDDNDDQY